MKGAFPIARITSTFDVTSSHLSKCAEQSPPTDCCVACGVRIKLTPTDVGVDPAKFCIVEELSMMVSTGFAGLVCRPCAIDPSFAEKVNAFFDGIAS